MKQIDLKYKNSFIPIIIIVVISFVLNYFAAGYYKIIMPSFPFNLIFLIIFIIYLITTFLIFRKSKIIEWFTSIPSSIAVISVYTFLILIMGLIPQQPHNHFIDKIGITDIKTGYPFLITNLLLLMVLGYSIIKRLYHKISLRNFAYFLNHAGLFIIIAGAYVGTGDLTKLSVISNTGHKTDIAVFSDNNISVKLPFQIKLNDFIIEEYLPELIVYDKNTGNPIIPKGGKLPFVEEGKKGKILDFDFEIIEYINFASKSSKDNDEIFYTSDKFGTVHAAKIKINDGLTEKISWISTDNFMHPAKFLFFDDNFVIGLSNPKVFKYQSIIDIYENDKLMESDILIEVNKPYDYKSWKIYQSSYDSNLGRWSKTSIFEIIKDPWLSVVYIGIYMVLFGSLYLIWTGRKIRNYKY